MGLTESNKQSMVQMLITLLLNISWAGRCGINRVNKLNRLCVVNWATNSTGLDAKGISVLPRASG